MSDVEGEVTAVLLKDRYLVVIGDDVDGQEHNCFVIRWSRTPASMSVSVIHTHTVAAFYGKIVVSGEMDGRNASFSASTAKSLFQSNTGNCES